MIGLRRYVCSHNRVLYSAIKKKLNLANCDNINRPEGDCDYAKQS